MKIRKNCHHASSANGCNKQLDGSKYNLACKSPHRKMFPKIRRGKEAKFVNSSAPFAVAIKICLQRSFKYSFTTSANSLLHGTIKVIKSERQSHNQVSGWWCHKLRGSLVVSILAIKPMLLAPQERKKEQAQNKTDPLCNVPQYFTL